MKNVIEYINEEYHWKDVKLTIQKEINTYSKEMIAKMKSEIKDDIDDQDNAIFKNEKSKVMKSLNIFCEEYNSDILNINEGIKDLFKKLFSKNGAKEENSEEVLKNLDDNTQTDFATSQYLALNTDDDEIKKAAKEQAEAATQGEKELLRKTKAFLMSRIDFLKELNGVPADNIIETFLKQYELCKNLSDKLKDNDGLKIANIFKKALDKCVGIEDEKDLEKYNKEIDNIENKINAKKDNSNNTENTNSSIGLSDNGEQKNVTKEQEKEAVTDDIKSNKNFFSPIAKEAGINGETLRDSIVGLINSSLKEENGKDNNGNTIYKWKTDTKGFQTKNEEKLIKGLGTIICGLLMINHKGMNEAVISTLIDKGFSKENLSALLK